jgi:hypothetical protein
MTGWEADGGADGNKDVVAIIALMLGPVIAAAFTLWCVTEHPITLPAWASSDAESGQR